MEDSISDRTNLVVGYTMHHIEKAFADDPKSFNQAILQADFVNSYWLALSMKAGGLIEMKEWKHVIRNEHMNRAC